MTGTINPLVSNNSKIKRETQFMADGNAEKVIDYLKKQLEGIKSSPNVNGNEIKCVKSIKNSLVTFDFQIIEITGDVCYIEVRRGKGDILEFNKLYRDFVEKCEIAFIQK
jgi:hypothetical protein